MLHHGTELISRWKMFQKKEQLISRKNMLHRGTEFISRWKMLQHGKNRYPEEEHVTSTQ